MERADGAARPSSDPPANVDAELRSARSARRRQLAGDLVEDVLHASSGRTDDRDAHQRDARHEQGVFEQVLTRRVAQQRTQASNEVHKSLSLSLCARSSRLAHGNVSKAATGGDVTATTTLISATGMPPRSAIAAARGRSADTPVS